MARTTTMAAIAALTLTVSACGSTTSETVNTIDDRPTTSTSTVLLNLPDEEAAETSSTTTASDAQADPFEVYLTLAPADAPDLTPDAASTRALLGCGTAWPPGTVDAALAEAYATFIAQWKDQGLCGQ